MVRENISHIFNMVSGFQRRHRFLKDIKLLILKLEALSSAEFNILSVVILATDNVGQQCWAVLRGPTDHQFVTSSELHRML